MHRDAWTPYENCICINFQFEGPASRCIYPLNWLLKVPSGVQSSLNAELSLSVSWVVHIDFEQLIAYPVEFKWTKVKILNDLFKRNIVKTIFYSMYHILFFLKTLNHQEKITCAACNCTQRMRPQTMGSNPVSGSTIFLSVCLSGRPQDFCGFMSVYLVIHEDFWYQINPAQLWNSTLEINTNAFQFGVPVSRYIYRPLLMRGNTIK